MNSTNRPSAGSNRASVLHAGTPLERAHGGVIFVHGRGAPAESMVPLAEALETDGLAYIFPQAPGGTWYPYSFMAPVEQNEPYLSAALAAIGSLFSELSTSGMPPEKVLLVGFSQGACLSLEYAARNPKRYGGVVALSGGLIGPPEASLDHPGSLADTPVFLGCSDIDPHIPKARVVESEQALIAMGAKVISRLYPGMGHTVNADELEHLRLLSREL